MSLSLIIVIAWLYVTILVAANEQTIVAGLISFTFYGVIPCGLIIYFAGSRVRRERQRYKESLTNQRLDDNDRGDPQSNQ